MDTGLAMVKGHPTSIADLTDEKRQAPFIAQPDPSTSVLRQFTRLPDVAKSELNSSVDRDQVWIYQDEISDMLAHARDPNNDFSMPPTLIARLVRFHLVDDLGGRSTPFVGPNQVKRAAFYAHVTRVTLGHARFTFIGNWSTMLNDKSIGIEGKIVGEFEVDTAALRITRFRAYADATGWGGGTLGHTEMAPAGKFRVVFAFLEGNDTLSRSIPPFAAFSSDYHDAHFWELPVATR